MLLSWFLKLTIENYKVPISSELVKTCSSSFFFWMKFLQYPLHQYVRSHQSFLQLQMLRSSWSFSRDSRNVQNISAYRLLHELGPVRTSCDLRGRSYRKITSSKITDTRSFAGVYVSIMMYELFIIFIRVVNEILSYIVSTKRQATLPFKQFCPSYTHLCDDFRQKHDLWYNE